MIKIGSTPKFIARIAPIVCICLVFIAALFFISIGEADLANKGLIAIAIPIILASIIALLKFELFNENELDSAPMFRLESISFLNLNLLFVILYILSLYILISYQTRSFCYFFLVSSMAVIILLEIASLTSKIKDKINLILIQIILLFLDMSLGGTLKYPMIILGTDIFYHLGFIETIIELGHVNSTMGFYEYFPLFHIFNSIGFFLTGIGLNISYFILNGLSFIISIILVYLIVNCFSKEPRISLLAALLYSFCRPVIDGGMYGVTRTMGYLICLLILYLLLQDKTNVRLRSITIFLIIPLVLVHQTTLVLFNLILILLFYIERVINQSYNFRFTYILLFSVSYISYWMFYCAPFFRSILSTFFLTTEPIFIPEELKITSLSSNIINYLDYGFLIFTGIIGAIFLLNQRGGINGRAKHTLALGALIVLPLYIPAIADLFSSFLGYRIPLQISPLIIFISSAGTSIFIFQWKSHIKFKTFIPVFFFVILACFFLLSSNLSAREIDYNMLPNLLSNENRGYFIQSELDSSSFLINHMKENSTIISDYLMFRFMNGYLRLDNSSSIIEDFGLNSYFLFRIGEYRSSGKLDFIIKGSQLGFVGELLKTVKTEESTYLSHLITNRSKVFSNGDVNIYRNGF